MNFQYASSSDHRPEAMADVPGACDLTLTRAVIQYRELLDSGLPGGRIQDIGLGLVLEGKYAGEAQVLDLGSGGLRAMDLGTELVILDWVYEPTLEHVNRLLVEDAANAGDAADTGLDAMGAPLAGGEDSGLSRYCFRVAAGVLERLGFSYLTRPTFLRIGFRDVCRDLDFHEGTAFRFLLGPRRVARVHMDYETGGLRIATGRSAPDLELEEALRGAFHEAELRRGGPGGPTGTVWYDLRLPMSVTLSETRVQLARVRRGMERLLARFEPQRFRAVRETLDALGERDTLSGLTIRDHRPSSVQVDVGAPAPSTVH